MGLLNKAAGLINKVIAKPLFNLISKGAGLSKWLNPAQQITAVGGRRVWLTLVLFGLVILCHLIHVDIEIIKLILYVGGGVTGSFVIGESARDTANARNGKGT